MAFRNERFSNGVCIAAEIVDLDAGTISFETNGSITSTRALTLAEVELYSRPSAAPRAESSSYEFRIIRPGDPVPSPIPAGTLRLVRSDGGTSSTADIAQVAGSKKTAQLAPGGRASSITANLQTPTAGNLLTAVVAAIDWDAVGTLAITASTAGWTEVTPATSPGSTAKDVAIFYKVAAGDETSVTFNTGGLTGAGLYVAEWSGIASTSPLDVKGNVAHGNTNPSTIAASGETSTAKSLWLFGRVDPAGSGTTWSNSVSEDYRENFSIAVAYRITTAAATPSTNLTLGSATAGWSMVAAFKGLS